MEVCTQPYIKNREGEKATAFTVTLLAFIDSVALC